LYYNNLKTGIMENLSILKVCYNPPLSTETVKDIQTNISWSMTSSDDTTKQYSLDFVLEWFKEFWDLESIEGNLKQDYVLLQFLLENEVEYIEI